MNERGYDIINPKGQRCFGSPISAEAVIFQARLWDRELNGLAPEQIKIVDESGTEYDVFYAVEFGDLERA